MLSLDVRHDPAVRDYADLDEVLAVAEQIAETVDRPPLILPWSEQPVLGLDRGRPWLYGPVERDPMALGGRTVVPGRQLRELRALAGRGLPFQRIAIAHELAPDGPVAQLLPVVDHGPRTCSDEVARALVGPVPPHPALAGTLRVIDRALRGAGRATAAATDLVLDPIVFGVLGRTPLRDGQVCLWVPMVAWRW
jgi:hypothetical protein